MRRSVKIRRLPVHASFMVTVLAALVALSVPAKAAAEQVGGHPRKLADNHVHLYDFVAETDGAAALVAAMDRAGVSDAVVFGMPLVKTWSEDDPARPGYYLDSDSLCYWYSATDVLTAEAIRALPDADRARLHPFISGFNTADRNAADHIRRMLDLYPGFWKGIGEVMSRHDDLTAFTSGDKPRADHPALSPVYDLAAESNLPVLIHHNITSKNVAGTLYLPELERALASHPKTRFIWAHAGISRNLAVADLPGLLARLFARYPNLQVDISWVVCENYIARDDASLADWVRLCAAYPDRLMIGSDAVGHFASYADPEKGIPRYRRLLDLLPEDVADKVGRGTMMAMLGRSSD